MSQSAVIWSTFGYKTIPKNIKRLSKRQQLLYRFFGKKTDKFQTTETTPRKTKLVPTFLAQLKINAVKLQSFESTQTLKKPERAF